MAGALGRPAAGRRRGDRGVRTPATATAAAEARLSAPWPGSGFWLLVTRLGEAQILLPAALAAAFWLARGARRRRAAARWLAAVAAAAALTLGTKLAFIGWGVGSAALGFTGVSGHAMFAAAVLPVLARVAGAGRGGAGWAATAGFALAALVAVSRVTTGAHSASEAVAGFVLGALASGPAFGGGRLGRWTRRAAVPPRWLPLLLGGWLLAAPAVAPAWRSHEAVTRLALALAQRQAPHVRPDLRRAAPVPALPTLAP